MVIRLIHRKFFTERIVSYPASLSMGDNTRRMELGRIHRIYPEEKCQNLGWNYTFLIFGPYHHPYFWITALSTEHLTEHLTEHMMISWVCLPLHPSK